MPDLYPKFDMPDLVEAVEDTSIAYPKSWLFDFDTGNFVLDGAGRVVEADGHTAWVQWCIKTILTQRFAYVIYSSDYGTELEEAQKQPHRKAVEMELERAITEALLVDPRTEMVRDFTFDWEGDIVKVSFTTVPVVGPPERLEVILNARTSGIFAGPDI